MNMPAQGTDQWLDQRKGKLTASVIGKVLTGSGKDSVLRDMVREALGYPRAFTGNAATEYGHEHEDEARTEYAMETGNAVTETGFHLEPLYSWMGASPDGLVGDDGLVEIKCPHSLCDADEVPGDLLELTNRDLYWHQMQCQMQVMNRTWCDFVVWCPTDMKIKRFYRDEGWRQWALDTCLPFLDRLRDVLLDDEEAERIAAEGVKRKGDTPDQLPALNIQMTGGVQASNLPDFKAQALAMIEGIKTELVTDKDFADAESTVKFLQKGEKQLEQSKQAALEQTASIAELFDTIDELRETMRQKRLYLNKLVKAEKDNRRLEIQNKASMEYDAWLNALDCPIRLASVLDLPTAMKGKRTMSSLQSAADDELARAKVEGQKEAKRLKENKELLNTREGEYAFLFSDWKQLICQDSEYIKQEVERRISDHKVAEEKRLEAERERIRQEEEAKAKREAEAQRQREAAEAEAKRQAEEAARKPKPEPEPEPLPAAAEAPLQRASEIEPAETVVITRKEYDRLLAAEAKLAALEDAGVDKWAGFQEAMKKLAA